MKRKWRLVEKANHLAVHALFESEDSARRFLNDVVPDYCERGIYGDKTLTKDSFEILPPETVS